MSHTDTHDEPKSQIADESLLACASLPTTLQVFASMGGLSLLAQHLPLLYPEISRQISPKSGSDKTDSAKVPNSSLECDWVKVDAAEDMFDVSLFHCLIECLLKIFFKKNFFFYLGFSRIFTTRKFINFCATMFKFLTSAVNPSIFSCCIWLVPEITWLCRCLAEGKTKSSMPFKASTRGDR